MWRQKKKKRKKDKTKLKANEEYCTYDNRMLHRENTYNCKHTINFINSTSQRLDRYWSYVKFKTFCTCVKLENFFFSTCTTFLWNWINVWYVFVSEIQHSTLSFINGFSVAAHVLLDFHLWFLLQTCDDILR